MSSIDRISNNIVCYEKKTRPLTDHFEQKNRCRTQIQDSKLILIFISNVLDFLNKQTSYERRRKKLYYVNTKSI